MLSCKFCYIVELPMVASFPRVRVGSYIVVPLVVNKVQPSNISKARRLERQQAGGWHKVEVGKDGCGSGKSRRVGRIAEPLMFEREQTILLGVDWT